MCRVYGRVILILPHMNGLFLFSMPGLSKSTCSGRFFSYGSINASLPLSMVDFDVCNCDKDSMGELERERGSV